MLSALLTLCAYLFLILKYEVSLKEKLILGGLIGALWLTPLTCISMHFACQIADRPKFIGLQAVLGVYAMLRIYYHRAKEASAAARLEREREMF